MNLIGYTFLDGSVYHLYAMYRIRMKMTNEPSCLAPCRRQFMAACIHGQYIM